MTVHVSDFEFANEPAAASRDLCDGVCVVRIPAGLTRKRQLLATLAKSLRFPSYFGGNWDAMDECFRDLSWLANVKTLVLIHADLPCAANPATAATYLAILRDRLQDATANRRLQLRVIFPQAARPVLEATLAAAKNLA